jgi:hypothetical protein
MRSNIKEVAIGQKLIIYAILLYLASIVAGCVLGPFAGLLSLAALVLSCIGTFRLSLGLDVPVVAKVLLLVLMFVPIVNVIALIMANARATRELRAAGYTVGFLGARM